MDIKILRATEEWQRAGAYSMPLRSLRSEVWGVFLEPQVPELVEGCGDRIHKQFKSVQVKAWTFFIMRIRINKGIF
jgi:hypothetical protein